MCAVVIRSGFFKRMSSLFINCISYWLITAVTNPIIRPTILIAGCRLTGNITERSGMVGSVLAAVEEVFVGGLLSTS